LLLHKNFKKALVASIFLLALIMATGYTTGILYKFLPAIATTFTFLEVLASVPYTTTS